MSLFDTTLIIAPLSCQRCLRNDPRIVILSQIAEWARLWTQGLLLGLRFWPIYSRPETTRRLWFLDNYSRLIVPDSSTGLSFISWCTFHQILKALLELWIFSRFQVEARIRFFARSASVQIWWPSTAPIDTRSIFKAWLIYRNRGLSMSRLSNMLIRSIYIWRHSPCMLVFHFRIYFKF